MPGINDLKNDGNEEQKKPFIPTIEVEPSQEPQPRYHNKGSVLSMTSGNPTSTGSKIETTELRQKADLSGLPEDKNESLGVDKRESVQKDILGPGGIFEQYVAEQKREMQEYIEDQELEAEISGENSSNIIEEDELGEVDELVQDNSSSYKEREINFDISGTKKKEETMGNVEENLVDNIATEKVEANEEVELEDVVEEIKEPLQVKESVEITKSNDIPVDKIENNDSVGFEDGEIDIKREIVHDTEDEVDDEEDDSDVEEDVDDTDDEKRLELLKSMVTEKLKPVSTRMNIKGFTIAKKGTTSNVCIESKEVPVAKWALPTTGVVIRVKEILGSNLEKLRYALSNNDPRTALQIVYSHIVSPKPATLEGWLKSVAFEDYDHLFMAIYIASFADSNYIPIDCKNPLCKQKTYITDNVDVMEMVKFKNDEAKAEFMKLYQSDTVEYKGLYPTEIVPISDKFAIGFVEPSIYSVMIETSYFDDAFVRKYSNTVTMIPYIDQIYQIDQVNKQLVPIEWKVFSNNIAKTIKSRIVRYDKIFSTMNSDEIAVMRAYVNGINKHSDMLTYQIPETTCPHCGHVNGATPNQSASALVFLRNQLGLLVTT